MQKLRSVILLACLGFAGPSAAQDLPEATAPAPSPPLIRPDCLREPDQLYCVAAHLHRLEPCKGSIDERLACLEGKVREQSDEIYALRRQLHERTSPRVSPL